MVANAKSSLMVGSLNIGQTQDVYDLLPRSVSETNVCTSYHRVVKYKHYRLLISHKSDEILFPLNESYKYFFSESEDIIS